MPVADDSIRYYFNMGFKYGEILAFLEKDNISMSMRTLKRHLKRLGLFRKKEFTDIDLVIQFIENQLQCSGKLHGYRWMHLRCVQAGFTVTQETVRKILKILDPRGVTLRQRKRLRRRQYSNKGPNYLWHMDSYDKLKPYGICINGCIDGFSRKIIWLRASFTTNNPRVVGGFYLEAIEKLMGCPLTVRTDMGTENGVVENLQIFFRNQSNAETSRPSFLYGTSQANQRIECWWSMLRKHNSQYWMDLFEQLKEDGLFSGSFLDKSLIQFCFMDLIQAELDQVVGEWNAHKIRKCRNSISAHGKPMVMYEFPEIFDCENYLVNVDGEDLNVCREECEFQTFDQDVFDVCNIIMEERGENIATDPYEALNIYYTLRMEIATLLSDSD